MKKILLSCFLTLGLCANAQTGLTVYSENFETSTNGSKAGWVSGWFGSATAAPAARNDFMVRSSTDCASNSVDGTGQHLQIVRYASNAFSSCTYGSQTAATYRPLIYTEVDASKYNNISISFDWLCQGQASQDYGRLAVSLDEGTFYWVDSNLLGFSTKQNKTINLSEYFESLDIDINYKKLYIGFVFEANTSTNNAPSLAVDNILVTGDKPTVVPGCTSFIVPAAASTISAGTIQFTWNSTPNASAYKVKVGKNSGGSDVFNSTVAGTSTNVSLEKNSTYFATITPTNEVGDAVGPCTEISFNTNSTVAYCGPVSVGADIEPISNVTFGGINNTTSATVNATDEHEFFLTQGSGTTGEVVQGGNPTFSVKGNTGGSYRSAIVVYIDWNNNGKLDDAGEVYFNEPGKFIYLSNSTGAATSTAATGNILVPEDAAVGLTRMRVKKGYFGSATTAPTIALYQTAGVMDPCAEIQYGQTEDYVINVTDKTLAVSDVNKGKVSVYPNPFTNTLNISDVKGVKSVSVSDVSGREVKSLEPSAELNLSSLKAGLYIVTLKMEDGSVKSFKAIKK